MKILWNIFVPLKKAPQKRKASQNSKLSRTQKNIQHNFHTSGDDSATNVTTPRRHRRPNKDIPQLFILQMQITSTDNLRATYCSQYSVAYFRRPVKATALSLHIFAYLYCDSNTSVHIRWRICMIIFILHSLQLFFFAVCCGWRSWEIQRFCRVP